MPELPEVETIVQGLNLVLPGLQVSQVQVLRSSVVKTPDLAARLQGQVFKTVTRRAKYLLFELSQGWLLAHLGMSGKFIFETSPTPVKPHDRVLFELSKGSRLIFNEIRCFGFLEWLVAPQASPRLAKLGPDALRGEQSAQALKEQARGVKRSIKEWLMDQAVIAGIGNIYACEILFSAQVLPTRASQGITLAEWKRILAETQRILQLAVQHNGTSISDYRRVDDKTGEFQNFLQVYGKEGQPCPRCGKPIRKIVQGGRGTWFCCKG